MRDRDGRHQLEKMNEQHKTVFDIEAIESKKALMAVPSPIGSALRPRAREKVAKPDEGRWDKTIPAERVRVRATFDLQLLTFNQMDPASGLSFSFTQGFNPVPMPAQPAFNLYPSTDPDNPQFTFSCSPCVSW
jgi:hypothetical protein